VSDAPRYETLRDYLRVLRAHRVVILLVTAVFGVAAYAISKSQDPVYRATAGIAFEEPDQDLQLLGLSASPERTAAQRATLQAERINTRVAIAERVKRELKTDLSVPALQGAVGARRDLSTDLVLVEGRWGDGRFAARLANEFARQAADEVNDRERAHFGRAARTLRSRVRRRLRRRNPFSLIAVEERVARLEALRDFARPAQLARPASVPGRPISPRPVRNAIFGALTGLALAILASFVRDALDLRLRRSREIQTQLKLPLLGHVRREAMGRGAVAKNGRGGLSDVDLEAFRMMRRNLELLDPDTPLRSVAVTSALPEEGKSTVATTLAAMNVAAGRRTLLVECDLRRASLAERLGIARRPGLAEFLVGRARPREILQAVALDESLPLNGTPSRQRSRGGPQEELVCITAGAPTARPAELLGSQRFREFLTEVFKAYEMVVLDTSPLLSVADTLEVLPYVDGIVMCVRASRTTREEAMAAKTALDHFPARPTGLVVTGVRLGEEPVYEYYARTYGSGERG
jgi:Mrp family chromosome partitioning ATPase/LPS O-antigen subunit length determinant protein (WzzB/FepE family)